MWILAQPGGQIGVAGVGVGQHLDAPDQLVGGLHLLRQVGAPHFVNQGPVIRVVERTGGRQLLAVIADALVVLACHLLWRKSAQPQHKKYTHDACFSPWGGAGGSRHQACYVQQ